MDPQVLAIKDSALIVRAAATLTASANSAAFDIAQGATLVNGSYAPGAGGAPMQLVIPITSYSGTSPTYTAKVQDSPDGTTWTDRSATLSIATENIPATGGLINLGFFSKARYVRIVETIGGTTPSFVLGDAYIVPFINLM